MSYIVELHMMEMKMQNEGNIVETAIVIVRQKY
jgi:hypothetical protein